MNQFEALREKLADHLVVALLLCGLPEEQYIENSSRKLERSRSNNRNSERKAHQRIQTKQ